MIASIEEAERKYRTAENQFNEISQKYDGRKIKAEPEDIKKLGKLLYDLREIMSSDLVLEKAREIKPDKDGYYRERHDTLYGKAWDLRSRVVSLIAELLKQYKTKKHVLSILRLKEHLTLE